ncbi:MAG: S1 RNA-binding domain-containing protein [Actinomycetota bacterium]|nr:S1 RNA-binding domain-containing protein [Actinomycetota bacterium]
MPIEVRVGRVVKDHSGDLRIFLRTDGRGRFLLREAHHRLATQVERGQVALSLDPGYQGLLEELTPGALLTATVVPGRAEESFTITLLELFRQHVSGASRVQKRLDPHDPKSEYVAFFPAVVKCAVNEHGWMTAQLLHQDSAIGLWHAFRVKPSEPGPDVSDAADSSAGSDLPKGAPLAIRLEPVGRSSLSLRRLAVAGLDLDSLEALVRESARTLKLEGHERSAAPDESEESDLDEEMDVELLDELGPTARPAPETTRVALQGEKPLDRASAVALAALDDSPAWHRRVWSFWARTHHLLVARRHSFVPHDSVTPTEHHIETTIVTDSRLDLRRADLAAFATQHPQGSTLLGHVIGFAPGNVNIELEGGLEAFLPLGELDWNYVEDAAGVVHIGEQLRLVLIEEVDLSGANRPVVSRRLLLPDPFAAFVSAHASGEVLSGLVHRISASHVSVRLPDEVTGSIHISDVSYEHVESLEANFEPGDPVQAAILGFDADRRQVNLSIKALLPKPFDEFRRTHGAGAVVAGTVRDVTPNRVYLDLGGGVKGAVFIREWAYERIEHLEDHVSPGETVRAAIVDFDADRGQVNLSVKALLPKPYDAFKASHRVGETLVGIARKVTDTHVYVELDGGRVDGAVHIRELAYDHVEKPSDRVGEGEQVRAAIKSFNDARSQVELSIKALLPKPYDAFKSRTAIGATVDAEVTGMNKSFAYVSLPGGADGSIHISKLASYRVPDPSAVVTRRQRVRAIVLGFDDARSKVELALAPATVGTAPSAPPPPSVARPAARPPVQARATSAPPPVRRSARAEGRSVEEATRTAAAQLGRPTSQVTARVIRSPKTSLLGRVKETAIVEVTEI